MSTSRSMRCERNFRLARRRENEVAALDVLRREPRRMGQPLHQPWRGISLCVGGLIACSVRSMTERTPIAGPNRRCLVAEIEAVEETGSIGSYRVYIVV